MTSHQALAIPSQPKGRLNLSLLASCSRLRVLAWDDSILYASRGYHLLRRNMGDSKSEWEPVAKYRTPFWRSLSCSSRLGSRLFRDGFHALAKLSSGDWLAAVPGEILRLRSGESEFKAAYRVRRGMRPLHIAVTPDNYAYWGEYFDNPRRDEVHVYASSDSGCSWDVAYTFSQGAIRHIHNIVYDPWQECLWVLTGDHGDECRVLRASPDFRTIDTILSGNQQARAAAAVPAEDGLYFASDTPLEQNHIYRLDRRGNVSRLAELSSSSIYACQVGKAIFFSTMVEPSTVNLDRSACIYGSQDRITWNRHLEWTKDSWPMRLFQYGNATLPNGRNTTNFLAVSTVAVEPGDAESSVWQVS